MRHGIAALLMARLASNVVLGFSMLTAATNTGTGPTVSVTKNSLPAGTLLLFLGANEDNNTGFTPGSGTINDNGAGLSWSQKTFTGSGTTSQVEVWTATFTAGGNITVTWTGAHSGDFLSGVLVPFTGADLTVGGALATAINQGQFVTNSITPNKAGSYLVSVCCDFSGNDEGSTTYLDSATEILKDFQSGGYTAWYFYKFNDAVGVPVNQGLTAGNAAPAVISIATIEIRSA